MMYESTDTVPVMEPSVSSLQNGRIVSMSGRRALVDIRGSIEEARIAFSCLVQPIPGDLVLCTKTETGIQYILAIIERTGKQNMTVSFPADAALLAEEGSLGVVGKSLTLAAGEKLSCYSDQVIHKSRDAVVNYEELTAKGTNLQASYKTVNLISRLITTIAGQCIQRMKNFIRQTKGSDRIAAGQMTRNAEGLFSLDSKHTVLVSKKDTKIDGERIHMG